MNEVLFRVVFYDHEALILNWTQKGKLEVGKGNMNIIRGFLMLKIKGY
jgi:hypothetical protein